MQTVWFSQLKCFLYRERIYQTTLMQNGVKSSDPRYSDLDQSLDLLILSIAGSNTILL